MKAKDFIMNGGSEAQKKTEEVENADLFSIAGYTQEGTAFMKELVEGGVEEFKRLKSKFTR